MKTATVAKETVEILKRGTYINRHGETVNVRAELDAACTGSLRYEPEDFAKVFAERDAYLQSHAERYVTSYEVTNETTLYAARRLVDGGCSDVLCLNFASAKNPGGGFLNGAKAQEESIARQSGLYFCLMRYWGMYEVNRKFKSCLYRDAMIYSPLVTVIRDDRDDLLDVPFLVSILTSPAVNAGVVRRNEPGNVPQIEPVMRGRIEKVLSVACTHGHRTLVLGAWGCGVFQNEPAGVARWFHEHLKGRIFCGVFEKVVFAVLDRSREERFIGPFRRTFLK